MRTFFVTLLTLFATITFAVQTYAYTDGKTLCDSRKSVLSKEQGFYVNVPIDYANPLLGTTPIYAHFENGFDKSKPTFLFFTGGPGGPSHFLGHPRIKFFNDLGFNFLSFDQRGIACSRPQNESLYNNPDFYSSENTARDADEIRKFLGINKVSVYGVSYGTTVATIYASLFASHTNALVLEGILYGGDRFAVKEAEYTRELIQKRFDALPELVRSRINDLTERGVLNPEWYSTGMVMQLSAQGDYSLKEFNESLAQGLSYPDGEVENETRKLLQRLLSIPMPDLTTIELISSDNIVYRNIACKEFGISEISPNQRYKLVNGKVEVLYDKAPLALCGYKMAVPVTYLAANYPVSAPITYFHGTADAKTSYPEARDHFVNVAKGTAQLIAVVGGGHMPSGQVSESGSSEQQRLLRTLFSQALSGEKLKSQEIELFNAAGIFKFKTSGNK